MTKTPIEPEDIREGDLIRVEFPEGRIEKALEFRAEFHGQIRYSGSGFAYFLLDRPKPVVVLPTEPGHYLPAYEYEQKGLQHD